jgi:hypothetical protein
MHVAYQDDKDAGCQGASVYRLKGTYAYKYKKKWPELPGHFN